MAKVDGSYLETTGLVKKAGTTPYRTHPTNGAGFSRPTGASVAYTHRAWNSNTSTYVFWTLTSEDPTGASSGYNPAFLSDIVLLRIA